MQCNEPDCEFVVPASSKGFMDVMAKHQLDAHRRGIKCRFCPRVAARVTGMARHEAAHGSEGAAWRTCRRCNWLAKETKCRPIDRRRHMLEFHEGEEWESKE